MAGPYPDNEQDMLRANYQKLGTGRCKQCQTPGQWWLTTYKKKILCDLPQPNGLIVKHVCPPAETPAPPDPDKLVKTHTAQLGMFRLTRGGRVAVMIEADGMIASAWAKGLTPDELYNDLIAAANFVRQARLNEQTKGVR